MSVPSPVLVFVLVALVLLVRRRVSVPVALVLVFTGVLVSGTWLTNEIAYPFAVFWSHLRI